RTSLPLGEPTLEHEQGSSTARAPAQAGDAGSSPAPVAKPDPLRGPDGELTTLVLGIVNDQLDELDARRGALPPTLPWSTPALVEVPEELAAPTTEHAYGNGGQGLTSLRARELGEWGSDRAYRHHSPAALAAGALDAELRAILRKEVSPELVE